LVEIPEADDSSDSLIEKESAMPRGEKSAYTDKQKRKAEHIEESYESRGLSEKEAERRAWATINKQDGGGKKSGSGKS
jgi:plasmid stabilization system protein ParE